MGLTEAARDFRVVSDEEEEWHLGKYGFVQEAATRDSARKWRTEVQILDDNAASEKDMAGLESKSEEYAERAQQEYLARKKNSEEAFAKEREEFAKEFE